MKLLFTYIFLQISFSCLAQYERNEPDNPGARKEAKEKPVNQDQTGELREQKEANYQSTRDNKANVTSNTVNTASSLISLLQFVTDNYSKKPTILKVNLGFGLSQIPLIVNAVDYSSTEKIYTGDGLVGINLGILKNKSISFNFKPYMNAHFPEIIKGNQGLLFEYGINNFGYFSKSASSKVKLFMHIGYKKISGDFSSDGSNGDAFFSNLNYSVVKLGGGVMFHKINYDKEFWIKPEILFEKPSFLGANQKPVMSFNLNINLNSQIEVDLSASQNYFIGGIIENSTQFIPKNQTFFNLTIIRNGKIF